MNYQDRALDYKNPGIVVSGSEYSDMPQHIESPPLGGMSYTHSSDIPAATVSSTQYTSIEVASSYTITDIVVEDL